MSDDTDARLARIEADVADIKTALRGQFGGPGLVTQMLALQQQVSQLQADRAYARGMTAVLAIGCSAVVSAAARLLIQ